MANAKIFNFNRNEPTVGPATRLSTKTERANHSENAILNKTKINFQAARNIVLDLPAMISILFAKLGKEIRFDNINIHLTSYYTQNVLNLFK